MGKTNIAGATFTGFGAFRYEGYNGKDPGFNRNYQMYFEKISGVTASTGLELGYFQAAYTDSYDLFSGGVTMEEVNTQMRIYTFGIYRKWFNEVKGSIAPYGQYFKLGLRYNLVQDQLKNFVIHYAEPDGFYPYVAIGKQHLLTESILFNYGFETGYYISFNEKNDWSRDLETRIRSFLGFNFTIGAAYLF